MKKKYYISAQYYFLPQENLTNLKDNLLSFLKQNELLGTLIIAPEGMNGTLASLHESSIVVLHRYLKTLYPNIAFKTSTALLEVPPFYRSKVVIKKEIVTMDEPHLDIHKITGEYVEPEKWSQLVRDTNTVLIDTRNEYEYKIGTFEKAINPKTDSFKDFKKFAQNNLKKDQKIAMFCTGGIRCEKASSWLVQNGYNAVYQLKGGILNYLENVPANQSIWQGECFVFDNRVSVKHDLNPGTYDLCHGCRNPITSNEKKDPHYQVGVCCPQCYTTLSEEQKQRFQERHKQVELAKQRSQQHIGQLLKKTPL